MDPNIQQQAPVQPQPQPVNPVLQQIPVSSQPQAQPASGGGKKRLILLVLFLLLIVLAVAGYFGYTYFKGSNTYNAGVYNYPTSPTTPTPTEVINPKDTTDSAIDSDNKVVDQQLNSLNSDMSGVDESLNDKQTNLQ